MSNSYYSKIISKIPLFLGWFCLIKGFIFLGAIPLIYNICNPELTQMQVLIDKYPLMILGLFECFLSDQFFKIYKDE